MLHFPFRTVLVCACVFVAAITLNAAQTPAPEWVWINGSQPGSNGYPSGHHGEMGVPGFSFFPSVRSAAAHWLDSSGNLWLFGGDGLGTEQREGFLNDLWMFNPSTETWTWVSGSLIACRQDYDYRYSGCPEKNPGHYGTVGVADPANQPGGRQDAAYWTDNTGKLWLYGGTGLDENGAGGSLGDLWMFDPSTWLWTWVAGSPTVNPPANYGTIGSAADSNTPGGISKGSLWVDSSGTGWMYDRVVEARNSAEFAYSDLWKLNFSTHQWTCVLKGTKLDPTYVGPGNPAADPFQRVGATTWLGADGQLWMHGGVQSSIHFNGVFNDLWKLNPSTAIWTWVQDGGAGNGNGAVGNDPGIYGTPGTFGSSIHPPARYNAIGWTDSAGNFWLFGGEAEYQGYSDLWEFSSSLQEWAWMGGIQAPRPTEPGYYPGSLRWGTWWEGAWAPWPTNWGTHRLPAATNYPGGRRLGASWYDGARVWIFGGRANNPASTTPYTVFQNDDLWEFAPVTPAPQFSPGHGSSKLPQTVTITDSVPGAIIRYTSDGTVPTPVHGNVYSGPVPVTDATHRVTILKAVATAPGMAQSIEVWATYKLWPVD